MGALAAVAAAGAVLLFLFLFEASEGQLACAPPSNAFCPQGYCCGNNGYCGAGEGYCAPANCLSQCSPSTSAAVQPPPSLAGLYYDPPPLYYYYPPKENPHGVVWWLGIVGAVVAVTLGAIIVCWFIARSAARYKNDNCECD